jgi:hypothetical protein
LDLLYVTVADDSKRLEENYSEHKFKSFVPVNYDSIVVWVDESEFTCFPRKKELVKRIIARENV